MIVAVPRETSPGERRVALVPDVVAQLTKAGAEVRVERGAGEAAGYSDAAYGEAGAVLAGDAAAACAGADVVLRVRGPSADEVERLPRGGVLIGLIQPYTSAELVNALAAREVSALAMELIPRITRAQRMDALSSQATIAGYKAALLGADALGKIFPMLTTAAGTIPPAKVLVIGAGVAGLQAIATAKRLGAKVQGFDIRPAAKEQVESLGATFVGLVLEQAETTGGYAKEVAEDVKKKEHELLHRLVADADVVITTALVPGRRAPELITEDMVADMRPGSVIVDLAAEAGGNCVLTQPGRTVVEHDVTIIGLDDAPSRVPQHASQMYARNLQALLEHLTAEDAVRVDPGDEITGACLVTHGGEIVHAQVREMLAVNQTGGLA